MSENDDLGRALEALARTDEVLDQGMRRLSRPGGPSPLQAVLTEISETVLTRDLVFRFGSAGEVVVTASGHKLVALRKIDRLASPQVAAQLEGHRFAGATDPKLRALIACLMPLDLMTEPVFTASHPSDWGESGPTTGLRVEGLAEKLSIAFPFVPVPPLQRLLDQLTPLARCFYLGQGEEEPVAEGTDDDIADLIARWEALLTTAPPTAAAPSLTLMGQHDEGDLFLAATDGPDLFLCALRDHSADAIVALWSGQ